MKAILYVGGALMVAASIYGFIDYKKSSHDKKFRALYENKKEATASGEKRELNAAKEVAVKVAEANENSSLKTNEQGVNANSSTEKKVGKKKRKVTLDKYSRAPLDEKYSKEEVKIEPKKEASKVVRKDSVGEKKDQ
jgi:hypothetical protein